MSTKNILVVDDDAHIREVIGFALEKANMTPTMTENGLEAVTLFSEAAFDLIVLDINMPEMDGLECCREIRKHSEIPILFLSSRDEEIDRILGLEIGGDDYVTKPFSPRELVARINAILKRTQHRQAPEEKQAPNLLSKGLLSLDLEQHIVTWNQQAVKLTATEFAMLANFLRQPNRVFSRELIMDAAYQYNVHVSDRTIDSHIRHVRNKFSQAGCEKLIETVHGVGYKLSSCK